MDVGQFFFDWVPSLGVVAGAGFAVWKWLFAERLRRQREIPTVDRGQMRATPHPIDEEKIWVQLDISWRNPGVIPYHVDLERTRIDVFAVPTDLRFGPLDDRRTEDTDLGEPIFSHKPFRRLKKKRIEPGAEDVFQSHFVLKRDSVVLFRWKLCRANPEGRTLSSTRFLLFTPNTLEVGTSSRPIEANRVGETDE